MPRKPQSAWMTMSENPSSNDAGRGAGLLSQKQTWAKMARSLWDALEKEDALADPSAAGDASVASLKAHMADDAIKGENAALKKAKAK